MQHALVPGLSQVPPKVKAPSLQAPRKDPADHRRVQTEQTACPLAEIHLHKAPGPGPGLVLLDTHVQSPSVVTVP